MNKIHTLSSGRPFHHPRESPSLLKTKTLAPTRKGSCPLSEGRKSLVTVATTRRKGHRKTTFNLQR